MRTVGEICEDHEQVDAAPHRWIFRPYEPVRMRFYLAHQSFRGTPELILQRWHDGQTTRLPVTTVESGVNAELTVELCLEESYYIYRLSWQGLSGEDRASAPRFIAVSGNIPRSVQDLSLATRDAKPAQLSTYEVPPTSHPARSGLVYSLILDRFAVGRQPAAAESFLQKTSPFGRHGGNIDGLAQRLDYLVRMGVSTILLNPVYVNENLLYHGYHPLSLFMVDPLIGTADELKSLVRCAHVRGLKVMIDVVCNHLGDMIDWDKASPAFKYYGGEASASTPVWGPQTFQSRDRAFSTATLLPYPEEARMVSRFHGMEFQDPIRCRLFGLLEDWRTEDHQVRRLLIDHVKYLISEFDFDGVRYDAVRHVEPDFWRQCIDEVAEHANQLGKGDFPQVAEHAGAKEADFQLWREAGFSSMLQFPLSDYLRAGLTEGHGVTRFVEYLCSGARHAEVGAKPDDYLFLDSHDRTRLLHDVRAAFGPDAIAAFHICIATLLLGQLTPMIYYGTEQEFDGALGTYWNPATDAIVGHDCYVREDMFPNEDCLWLMGELNNPKFQAYCDTTPTYRILSWLAMMRQRVNILEPVHLNSDSGLVAGVAFSVINACEHLVIIVNTSREAAQGSLWMPIPNAAAKEAKAPFLRGGQAVMMDGALEYTIEPLGILAVLLQSADHDVQ